VFQSRTGSKAVPAHVPRDLQRGHKVYETRSKAKPKQIVAGTLDQVAQPGADVEGNGVAGARGRERGYSRGGQQVWAYLILSQLRESKINDTTEISWHDKASPNYLRGTEGLGVHLCVLLGNVSCSYFVYLLFEPSQWSNQQCQQFICCLFLEF
jgi:hypothetical protein